MALRREWFSRYSKNRKKAHMCVTVKDAGRTCAPQVLFFYVCITECMWRGPMTGTESFRAEYELCQCAFCSTHTWI